jgi:hypothetical protein
MGVPKTIAKSEAMMIVDFILSIEVWKLSGICEDGYIAGKICKGRIQKSE